MSIFVGMDEVGRGAWAGDVVTGASVFNLEIQERIKIVERKDYLQFIVKGDDILITDSKKMTPNQREVASKWIFQNAFGVGIGKASVHRINKAGIVKATNFAYRMAFKLASQKSQVLPEFVLIDGFFVPRVGVSKSRQKVVIKGDCKEFSIAAASIVAKVYRDQKMTDLSLNPRYDYEKYLWHENKGYGTAEHANALRKFGTTKLHRKLFVRNYI